MRIKELSVLLLLVGFIVSCKSTKQISETPAVVSQKENYDYEDALLWEITGNNLPHESYLFGTIHMISADRFFWPDGALAAFDKSQDVVFEIDLDDMFDMGAQMGLITKAFMSDNQKLSDFYSEEDWGLVKSHFDNMGIPMFFLEKLKPMFLTVFASGDVEMGQGFGEDSSMKSYEMEIYELAQDSKKDVDGLESMEYQMSVFDSIPYQVQADMLIETIKSSDSENDAFKEMVDMYVAQDINRMVSAMSEEEAGIEGYEDVLLYQRNRNWIPIMSEKMKTAKTFFAVGAGHLGGKDGVIDLLQREGYTLKPLSHKKG